MSNLLTDWRQAVTGQLAAQLQGGSFTVQAGERDGPSRDRKLACVFAPAIASDNNVSFARPVLVVRAWLPLPRTPKSTQPHDPEPIEQLMIDLAACLKPLNSLPAVGEGGLLAYLAQIRPDYVDWGVEATLQGWTANPAAAGA